MKKAPARLHVLLAREAPVGLVIRRGPAKSVAVIGWDRRKNKFTLGQWLRGRIYERRSDLSPDGKYFIYFAGDYHFGGTTGGTWTAISQVPFLKAVVLYGKGDAWNGGGLFTGKRRYWLNDKYTGHRLLQPSGKLQRDLRDSPFPHYGSECPGLYHPRLQRDGWTLQPEPGVAEKGSVVIFEKPLPKGWVLRKLAHAQSHAGPGKGVYWDSHELQHGATGKTISLPDWELAEWADGKLYRAVAGCLYASGWTGPRSLDHPRLLQDFNDMKFEAMAAPY